MAFSKSQIPFTAQHYLVCGTEDCEENCQFYCNDCHQPMCEQCRDEHQKSPDTKNHEVVPYQQRKRQLPEVKCQIHVNRYLDMLCEQCQVPVCSKCAIKDHGRHIFIDLETVYAEKCAICLNEINKIEEYFLPTSQDLLKSTKTDSTEIKKIMESIRTSMRAEAESLKSMVDAVTSDNIKQLNEQEKSLLQLLNSQDKKYNDYISYLNELVKKCHGYLSSKNLQILMSEITKNLKIDPIPETTRPVPPVFTAGQYSKEDVTKLLGRVTVPDTKPEIREIKPMETVSTQLKYTGKQKKQDREKSDMKLTLSLSSSITEVREYKVPGVINVYHISLGKSGRHWASDYIGNLVQADLQGNQLQKIQTSGGCEGYHTVTQVGDLIFTDKEKKIINRITLDNIITEFIKTGDWKPFSIYSSHINGDILVGMIKDEELAKVTRYNKTGEEIQNIERDNKGQGLYSYPLYITENINGDICVSDLNKGAVVVVNKSGQYRFSYTGQGSKFYPFGICTDLLSHIIVCGGISFTVDILDQNGQFLSLLLTQQQGMIAIAPRGLCVDDENNLHVGKYTRDTVSVYKYLQ
uniref:B box-type domain-containing protein n=1 Tax=Magallana gigas TaxID=29159 RepID=A0A8W8JA72_MAGGI|nr:tripartite motif-containing protein 2-like isoform X1 [Crassostrea gigas]XP_034312245.1 tripartite motif-containing protein 2-like isoform X1 [Crassostrea gigas]XP_034312246.1 tripartite motif-containing protein 2-like isoform X1 [Crassostrea gigas]XP_034312247.1 tripartite motif-containing protein 2-like isoform X1 [Crassostrea gigas]